MKGYKYDGIKYYYGFSVHDATNQRRNNMYRHVRVVIHERQQPLNYMGYDEKLQYKRTCLSITWQSGSPNFHSWGTPHIEMQEFASSDMDAAMRALKIIKRVELQAARIEAKRDSDYYSTRWYLRSMSPMKFVETLSVMGVEYLINDPRLWEYLPMAEVMPPHIKVYVMPGSDGTAMHWVHADDIHEARIEGEQWLRAQVGKRRVWGPLTYEEEYEIWVGNGKPIKMKADGDKAPEIMTGLEVIKRAGE